MNDTINLLLVAALAALLLYSGYLTRKWRSLAGRLGRAESREHEGQLNRHPACPDDGRAG